MKNKLTDTQVRFDVLEIILQRDSRDKIRLIRDAFQTVGYI